MLIFLNEILEIGTLKVKLNIGYCNVFDFSPTETISISFAVSVKENVQQFSYRKLEILSRLLGIFTFNGVNGNS